MLPRSAFRLSCALIAAFAFVGCDDDTPSGNDDPGLEVTPLFTGIAEGDTLRLSARLNGQPVAVTWDSQFDSVATVDATGLVTAVSGGFTPITATATSGQMVRSASITVIPIPVLVSGTARTGLSGATGSQQYFKITIPAGITQLKFTMSLGTGDADLYVRRGARPTLDVFDCAPFAGGNAEECTFNNPAAGTWYVLLDAFAAYSGVRLVATVTP